MSFTPAVYKAPILNNQSVLKSYDLYTVIVQVC